MYSINFPDMFTTSRTKLIKDHDATLSNLKLLLASEKTSLFGDPYFGTILKRIIYEQNTPVLQDLVIDEIYTSILMFMPQIKIERKDISLSSDGTNLYAKINCINLIDYTNNLYNIRLTNNTGEAQ